MSILKKLVLVTAISTLGATSLANAGCVEKFEKQNIKLHKVVSRASNGKHILTAFTLQELLGAIGLASNPATLVAYFAYPIYVYGSLYTYNSNLHMIKLIGESKQLNGEDLSALTEKLSKKLPKSEITNEKVANLINELDDKELLCNGGVVREVSDEEYETVATRNNATVKELESFLKQELKK